MRALLRSVLHCFSGRRGTRDGERTIEEQSCNFDTEGNSSQQSPAPVAQTKEQNTRQSRRGNTHSHGEREGVIVPHHDGTNTSSERDAKDIRLEEQASATPRGLTRKVTSSADALPPRRSQPLRPTRGTSERGSSGDNTSSEHDHDGDYALPTSAPVAAVDGSVYGPLGAEQGGIEIESCIQEEVPQLVQERNLEFDSDGGYFTTESDVMGRRERIRLYREAIVQADRNHAREVGLSIREDDDSSRGIPESVLTPHGTVVAPGSAAGGGPVTALHMSDNTAQRDREALRRQFIRPAGYASEGLAGAQSPVGVPNHTPVTRGTRGAVVQMDERSHRPGYDKPRPPLPASVTGKEGLPRGSVDRPSLSGRVSSGATGERRVQSQLEKPRADVEGLKSILENLNLSSRATEARTPESNTPCTGTPARRSAWGDDPPIAVNVPTSPRSEWWHQGDEPRGRGADRGKGSPGSSADRGKGSPGSGAAGAVAGGDGGSDSDDSVTSRPVSSAMAGRTRGTIESAGTPSSMGAPTPTGGLFSVPRRPLPTVEEALQDKAAGEGEGGGMRGTLASTVTVALTSLPSGGGGGGGSGLEGARTSEGESCGSFDGQDGGMPAGEGGNGGAVGDGASDGEGSDAGEQPGDTVQTAHLLEHKNKRVRRVGALGGVPEDGPVLREGDEMGADEGWGSRREALAARRRRNVDLPPRVQPGVAAAEDSDEEITSPSRRLPSTELPPLPPTPSLRSKSRTEITALPIHRPGSHHPSDSNPSSHPSSLPSSHTSSRGDSEGYHGDAGDMALGSEVVGVMDPRGPGGMRYGKAKEATEARTRMVRARRRKMGE